MYKLIRQCRDNESLRQSFNRLAERTFGLSFETWHQMGYWSDCYIPYSFVYDGEIIANVSVNRMIHWWDGRMRPLIQLGTVMTDESFRRQGLIRSLMEEIERDFQGKAEGVYLFANDSVLDFYPKFGFRRAEEYCYERLITKDSEGRKREEENGGKAGDFDASDVCRVDLDNETERKALEKAIEENTFLCPLSFGGNLGLYMFYLSDFMKENVYYIPKLDAYAVAEIQGATLFLQGVLSRRPVSLEEAEAAFANGIDKIVLGFVPDDRSRYVCREHKEEDTTLFVKGSIFDGFEEKRLRFPVLGHA